jgi:hypothetical protein
MKVGLSFSRCIRDIVEARVDFNDVLVIIARTDFNPHDDEQWQQIWEGYRYGGGWSHPEWADAEDDTGATNVEEMYRHVSKQLYDTGKLHQPRQFGSHPARMPYYWLECVVPEDELSSNPTALKAWEKYKMLAGLTQ